MKFIDESYEPKEDDLRTVFRIEPGHGNIFKESASKVAMESSVGTWTDLSTINKRAERIKARVYELNEPYAKVAYPPELFELNNIPQIMSSIAGNIFGMKAVKNLRLVDLGIPKKMLDEYEGPRYGIKGVRKLMEVKSRPLMGTIVKPKLGLNHEKHAKVAEESWKGGCDIVKDDENVTNQLFNKFKDRLTETLESRDKAEDETGEKKVYMCNVTAPHNKMMERAEEIKSQGGRYLMVDVVTSGFSSLQELRNNGPDLVIHAHRAMHAAITRNKKHGITMQALGQLYRLIGVDQLHIGTAVGKMEGDKKEVKWIQENISKKEVTEYDTTMEDMKKRLKQNWHDIKPVFPVSSGGLHPGIVHELMEFMGNNIIIQAGGGIHGHPDGSRTGARAMRQAIDAKMKETNPWEYSEEKEELKKALELWGTK
ncbi:MAG: type III ribulose-bisphosphate carboxylase [archaeon]